MRLHGLRTVAKWFNCNAIRCADCALCKPATNWFAHFITCSVLACYIAFCTLHCIYCAYCHKILSGFTYTAIWWLISPLPKNISVSLQNDHWPSQKKYDCPTFAALFMRVIYVAVRALPCTSYLSAWFFLHPWAFYTWFHSRSHWPSWWAGLSSLVNTLCCFEHKWGERSPGALCALTSSEAFGPTGIMPSQHIQCCGNAIQANTIT